MMIDLEIRQRFPVVLDWSRGAQIVLVGCGGTGSFLALHLARLAYHARQQNVDVSLVFVDPDRVEEKNIGRQNFCPAEVGEYKAFSLARRFSLAFGLRIQALCGRLGEVRMEAPAGARRFFAGCVDTAEARREIAKRAQYGHWRSDWWLDGGNHEYSGQVYIGSRQHTAINLMGLCTDLPRPDVQAPDLLEDPEPISSVDETGLSCAELAAVDAQSLMINQAIAGWMAVYLSRMLITHDLDIMATYVDLVSGSVRSVPIERPSQEEE